MRFALPLLFSLALACSDDDAMMTPADGGGADATTSGPSLRDGTPVAFATVYTATNYTEGGVDRMWLPRDLAVHPEGQLWVVQHMERDPAFTDDTECTQRGLAGDPNDCVSQQGSTVAITDPGAAEAASAANGRANVVVDANAWHFMRRPSGIAFGLEEIVFEPSDPGGAAAGLSEPLLLTNTFATCHEHWTGNPTDMGPFIGPSLWTADPAIYNGSNGSFSWSNGSHLDMVHATQYCMGIAYETGNTYWTFNGAVGSLDRYDFGSPHHPGHSDHDDATVTRYFLGEGDDLVRVPTVPSNMVIDRDALWVADTGNGRVLRFDLSSPTTPFGTFLTYDGYTAETIDGLAYDAVLDRDALGAAWGGAAEPSGLARLPDGTMVVASHATGHITLFDADGTIVRTIDTETGLGLGGLTAMGETVYFVQMAERRIVRIDLAE